MADMVPRQIDWIDRAPVRIVAELSSPAAPDAVFDVLAAHEQWPQWFPGVKRVEVLGPASGVGGRRRVSITGAAVDEEFIVWDRGRRWSFTGISARPRIARSLIEDCVLEEVAGHGTRISYAMYIDPVMIARPLMSFAAKRIRANNLKALHNLSARAAAT